MTGKICNLRKLFVIFMLFNFLMRHKFNDSISINIVIFNYLHFVPGKEKNNLSLWILFVPFSKLCIYFEQNCIRSFCKRNFIYPLFFSVCNKLSHFLKYIKAILMKFSNNERVPTDRLLPPNKTSRMRTRLHQGSQRIVLIFLYLTMSSDPLTIVLGMDLMFLRKND